MPNRPTHLLLRPAPGSTAVPEALLPARGSGCARPQPATSQARRSIKLPGRAGQRRQAERLRPSFTPQWPSQLLGKPIGQYSEGTPGFTRIVGQIRIEQLAPGGDPGPARVLFYDEYARLPAVGPIIR